MSIPSARAFSNTTFCASDLSEVSDARRRLRTVRECPSRTSPASAKQSIECPLYGCGGKRGALMAQQWGRPFPQWRLPSGPAGLRSARHSTWQRVLVSALFAPVDASSLGGVSVVRRVSTSRINCSGGLNCFRSFATYARNRSPTARSAADRFLSLGAGINPKAAGRFWVPPEDKFARQFSGLTGPSLDFPD